MNPPTTSKNEKAGEPVYRPPIVYQYSGPNPHTRHHLLFGVGTAAHAAHPTHGPVLPFRQSPPKTTDLPSAISCPAPCPSTPPRLFASDEKFKAMQVATPAGTTKCCCTCHSDFVMCARNSQLQHKIDAIEHTQHTILAFLKDLAASVNRPLTIIRDTHF